MKWLTYSEPLRIFETAKATAELFHKDRLWEQLVCVYLKRTNQ